MPTVPFSVTFFLHLSWTGVGLKAQVHLIIWRATISYFQFWSLSFFAKEAWLRVASQAWYYWSGKVKTNGIRHNTWDAKPSIAALYN